MLLFTLLLIALIALAYAFPWIRRGEVPPRALLWIVLLALGIVGLVSGLPADVLAKMLSK